MRFALGLPGGLFVSGGKIIPLLDDSEKDLSTFGMGWMPKSYDLLYNSTL
jgi:hypothetical protein